MKKGRKNHLNKEGALGTALAPSVQPASVAANAHALWVCLVEGGDPRQARCYSVPNDHQDRVRRVFEGRGKAAQYGLPHGTVAVLSGSAVRA